MPQYKNLHKQIFLWTGVSSKMDKKLHQYSFSIKTFLIFLILCIGSSCVSPRDNNGVIVRVVIETPTPTSTSPSPTFTNTPDVPAPITNTPDGPAPPTNTPTNTPTPIVRLDAEVTVQITKCSCGKVASVDVTIVPSGGVPPYDITPAEFFPAKSGQFIDIEIKSADDQIWTDRIQIPTDCVDHECGGDGGDVGGDGGGCEEVCEEVCVKSAGNSGNCSKWETQCECK